MPSASKSSSPAARQFTLHVVSDATGSLARHFITAILTQFPDIQFKQVFHTFQDQPEKIAQTIKMFGRKNHLVVHSIVDPQAKQAIREACVQLKVPHFDLTGSLVQFLSDHTGVLPINELSRLHRVDAGYFLRVEAMEFTVQHDDGRGLETLGEADLVLVGLSRVSKTPTSVFLGSQGYKVANVSLAAETGFPAQLGKVKKKIVALTVQPWALQRIRKHRLEEFGVDESTYADPRSVTREVMWAQQEYQKRSYPILDVTGMTIEKAAASILKLLKVKGANQSYV